MDTKSWVSALELFLQYPVLLIATFVVACAAFYLAWWLRGHWATGTIEALKERLELAREQVTVVKSQLAEARETVTSQKGPTAYNTELLRQLSSVATSTSALSRTLTGPTGPSTTSSNF
jgi:hypothetical protein